MNTIELLGSTLGLSMLAGVRLYLTVFALGIGIRFELLELPERLSGLAVAAHPAVLITAGLLVLAEFVSDKVPWVDTLWDSIHTFIRPVGAALLGAAALGNMDPALRTVLALVCGGVALTSHSSKAATRVAVNHSPEPFSNIGLSLIGDIAAPVGVWLAVNHPVVTLLMVLVALVLFAFLARFIFRGLRAVMARLRRDWHTPGSPEHRPPSHSHFSRPENRASPYTARSESR